MCVVLSPLSAWKSVLYHRLPKRMRGEIFDRAICSRHEHLPYAEFLFFTVFALAGIAMHLASDEIAERRSGLWQNGITSL